MANNVVSKWLIAGCYIADDLNDEEATALAARLDRLVDADRVINQYFGSIGMICPIEVVEALSQQTTALADIELPKSEAQP